MSLFAALIQLDNHIGCKVFGQWRACGLVQATSALIHLQHFIKTSVPRVVNPGNDFCVAKQLGDAFKVADKDALLLLTGQGDVIEPDDGIMAIGSGGSYALAAARALAKHTQLGPRQIVEAASKEAGDLCIYTNGNVVVEELA